MRKRPTEVEERLTRTLSAGKVVGWSRGRAKDVDNVGRRVAVACRMI